jgi:sulfoxide reductase heme-binding subunit YedZ
VLLIHGLGANSIQYIEKRSGDAGLILLLACLACTPLRILTGSPLFTKFRRPLGLYAFAYAALHFLIFLGLDYGFVWNQILPLLIQKTYLWIGLITFLILLLLAVTSTRGWQKRLKKNWLRLHALVYITGFLVITHFAMSIKGNLLLLRGEVFWPFVSLVTLVILLAIRLKPVRALVSRLRR